MSELLARQIAHQAGYISVEQTHAYEQDGLWVVLYNDPSDEMGGATAVVDIVSGHVEIAPLPAARIIADFVVPND